MDFYHMVVRGAAAYSPFHRSKTHLVYTTDDLRIGFVDRIHFFGRAHPENRAYALPIGKVGLAAWPTERATIRPSHEAKATTNINASKAVKAMVHHSARAGASSRTLGAHTAVSQPVKSDHADACSECCASESVNSNTPPDPARCHCAAGSSFPIKASSCSDRAMMRCAASAITASQPGGRSIAATRPASACRSGDLARA